MASFLVLVISTLVLPSTTLAVGYKCVGAIHAPNTEFKAGASTFGTGLAGAGVGAAAGAAVGSVVPVIGTTIGAVVGGGLGMLEGAHEGNKMIRFHGSAYQCMNYGGVCCTGNFRGTQDFIVGQDLYDSIPCAYCWGSIERKIFSRN